MLYRRITCFHVDHMSASLGGSVELRELLEATVLSEQSSVFTRIITGTVADEYDGSICSIVDTSFTIKSIDRRPQAMFAEASPRVFETRNNRTCGDLTIPRAVNVSYELG